MGLVFRTLNLITTRIFVSLSLNRFALCVIIRVAPDQQCDGAGDCLFVLAQCANTFAMCESPEKSDMVLLGLRDCRVFEV